MTMFWIILMVALLIFEAVTYGLFAVWFAIGAMVAAMCAAINLYWLVQLTAFLLVSTILLLLLRPFVKRMVTRRATATNSDRVYEMRGVVTEEIDNAEGRGAVYIDGKTWTARSFGGGPIAVDTHVSVKLIDGVKLIVEPAREDSEAPAQGADTE